ncbi:hypothetical protein V2A60_008262 [Cordyceps javanica]
MKRRPRRDEEDEPLMDGDCGNGSRLRTSLPAFRNSVSTGTKLVASLATAKDLVLISFAMIGFISLVQSPVYDSVPSQVQRASAASCDCGNSTAEALALGCKYDSLAATWLPEHCRNDELTAEFETSGPGPNGEWTYRTDAAHTEEISLTDIAKMVDNQELRFHMSGHWHVVHCIFYWRKKHRARFNDKMVEPRSDNEKHIKHCGKITLDPGYGTVAGVGLNTDEE